MVIDYVLTDASLGLRSVNTGIEPTPDGCCRFQKEFHKNNNQVKLSLDNAFGDIVVAKITQLFGMSKSHHGCFRATTSK